MNKPTGYFKCAGCGFYWTGDQLYLDPMTTGKRWTCGDLTCGANVIELKPETIIKALVGRKKSATLSALLREAGEALEPFTHEDLRSLKVGNASGEESIVFARNEADLKIKHFARAADIQKRIQEVVK